MSQLTPKENERIERSFKHQDFQSICEIFHSGNFTFSELSKFYKNFSRKGLFKQVPFWHSKLPLHYLKETLQSDLKMTFYKEYFSKNEFCSRYLDQELLSISEKDYIRFFKLFKAFRHEKHLLSFKELSAGRYNSLSTVQKEIGSIERAYQNNHIKIDLLRSELAQLPLDEFLLAVVLWVQKVKSDERMKNDRDKLVRNINVVLEELTPILNIYSTKGGSRITYMTNEDINSEFKRSKVPDRFKLDVGELGQPTEIQLNVLRSLDTLLELTIQKNTIDLYCCGMADITELHPEEEIHFLTNEFFDVFQVNDLKKGPEEIYITKGFRSERSNIDLGSATISCNELEVLNFYGVNSQLKIKEDIIDLPKVFELLRSFSKFKGPEERTIGTIDRKEFKVMNVFNRASHSFIERFGMNESITIFDHRELIMNIQDYFEWTEPETRSVLSFLTLDLSKQGAITNWLFTPFIKHENQVLWLGALLKDRRWDNIILNKIKLTPQIAQQADIGKGLEMKLGQLFEENSFSVLVNRRFKLSDGQSGEIDLMAFKDDSILICEAKTSTRSDDYTEAVSTQNIELEGKAAQQLSKCETFLSENWPKVKEELGIDEDISLSALRVIPLIITDNFEGDRYIYKQKYRKISFLELDVILKNNKRELLQAYFFQEKIQNQNNFNLDIYSRVKVWDLWNDHEELSTNSLLNAIDKDLVWEGLRSLWNFNRTILTVPI